MIVATFRSGTNEPHPLSGASWTTSTLKANFASGTIQRFSYDPLNQPGPWYSYDDAAGSISAAISADGKGTGTASMLSADSGIKTDVSFAGKIFVSDGGLDYPCMK